MNNYKSFSKLKEELGDNYDFKLYEMGISALKEIENLQQENKQLKLINKEYERLNKENGRGFKITSVKQYNIDELLKCEDNWNKLKEYAKEIISTDNELYGTDLLNKMQELERGVSDDNH